MLLLCFYMYFFVFTLTTIPQISQYELAPQKQILQQEDRHNEVTSENGDQENSIHDSDADQKADYNNIREVPLYFDDEKVLTLRVQ